MNQSHRVVPRGGQEVSIHGVWASDRSFDDGPDGRPGQQCTLVVTIRARRDQLDGDVARVGFQGTKNGFPYSYDVPGGMENRSGLRDLLFPMRRWVPEAEVDVAPADAEHAEDADEAGDADEADVWHEDRAEYAYAGSFFVETSTGTYYWLKKDGTSDFAFSYDALPTLRTWGVALT